MYHRLASPESYRTIRGLEQKYTLPTDKFEEQISHFRENNYRFVTPNLVRQYVLDEIRMDRKAVMITFDDGCASVIQYAIPILEKYQACATLFVTTDPESYIFHSGDHAQRRATDKELREIDSNIMSIQSHTVTHRPLVSLGSQEMRFELENSKSDLEQITGKEVDYLGIPSNWYNQNVIRTAQETGYKAVWCSRPGRIDQKSNLFALPRLNVDGRFSLAQLIQLMSPFGLTKRRVYFQIKRMPARLLGPTIWMPLRTVIVRLVSVLKAIGRVE
jgi:peptidoglycan/xylan/chitin deacetylase (PgdA/CDA1 family)